MKRAKTAPVEQIVKALRALTVATLRIYDYMQEPHRNIVLSEMRKANDILCKIIYEEARRMCDPRLAFAAFCYSSYKYRGKHLKFYKSLIKKNRREK